LLQTLTNKSMGVRYDSIVEAHSKTFSWILQPQELTKTNAGWDDFSHWLQNEAGIYWITGKAASGKSTLMKSILSQGNLVKSCLRKWAGARTVICASFFFWGSGTPVHRSQSGLLQSLLYQVLRQCPNPLPEVLPYLCKEMKKPTYRVLVALQERWHTWTAKELHDTIERLLPHSAYRFFSFVDGLDEFLGDHTEIARTCRMLASSPNAKICLASRPLLVFEENFRSYQHLRLQDLTHKDIEAYVSTELGQHPRMAEIVRQGISPMNLFSEIVEKSFGVFLWVSLVVKSLSRGLTNYDTIDNLQLRLHTLSSELNELYALMLESIDPPVYFEQASHFLQIAYHARCPLSSPEKMFAVDKKSEDLFSGQHSPKLDASAMEKATIQRMISRCAGLLETRRPGSSNTGLLTGLDVTDSYGAAQELNKSPKIQFIHLTLKEFLEKPGIWTKVLHATTSTNFDAHVRLARSCIMAVQHSTDIARLDTFGPAWRTTLDRYLSNTVHLIQNAQCSTGESQIGLTDDLLELLQKYMRSRGVSEPRLAASQNQALVLSIAASFTLYVRTKYGPSLLQGKTFNEQPMLWHATDYTADTRRRYGFAGELQVETLATLLEYGLGPNEALLEGEERDGIMPGSTVWSKFLFDFHSDLRHLASSPERLEWRTGLGMCKMLVLQGANLDIEYNGTDFYIPEAPQWKNMLQNVIAAVPARDAQDLQDLIETQRAKSVRKHSKKRTLSNGLGMIKIYLAHD
jgi:hypothetical protein